MSESSDRVSGHLFLSNTTKSVVFRLCHLPLNSLYHNFVVFAKSEGIMVQQATTLIQKAESIGWKYRLANKN